jgi:hypothetical protein
MSLRRDDPDSNRREGRVSNPPFAVPARYARAGRVALALLSLAVFGGCMHPALIDGARTGPFYSPPNHAGDAQLPADLRRVVLLPIAGGSVATPESVAALDPVFLAELQKQNRFEIVPLTREECLRHFRAEEFLSTAALPHDFMTRLRQDHAADAVMFVDLTVFKPYRPLAIGVRAKLATLGGDVRLLWTFDNVFAASEPAVANSARHHFLDSDRGGIPADPTQGVLQSPTRFASYVAAAAFATLPPVYTPPPPPPAKGR